MQVLRSVPGIGELCDECGERSDVLLMVQKLGNPAVHICRGCLEQAVDWVARAEEVRRQQLHPPAGPCTDDAPCGLDGCPAAEKS